MTKKKLQAAAGKHSFHNHPTHEMIGQKTATPICTLPYFARDIEVVKCFVCLGPFTGAWHCFALNDMIVDFIKPPKFPTSNSEYKKNCAAHQSKVKIRSQSKPALFCEIFHNNFDLRMRAASRLRQTDARIQSMSASRVAHPYQTMWTSSRLTTPFETLQKTSKALGHALFPHDPGQLAAVAERTEKIPL